MRRLLILIAKISAALMFVAIAVRVLVHEFSTISPTEVSESLGRIGWDAIGLSAIATIIGFAAVGTYDAFAMRYAGKQLSLSQSMLSSTTSYAVSNLLGFPVFTGNAVRFWLFEHWGHGAADVAICAVVTTIVANLMLAFIAAASFLLTPNVFELTLGVTAQWSFAIGLTLLAAATAITVFAIAGPTALRVWRFSFNHPGPLLISHLMICIVDYAATAAVFYVLLGDNLEMHFLPFVALFSTAKLIGIISNIPGGLGVFEAAMASTMGDIAPADLAAVLIAYRCIFYLAPFAVAVAALAGHGLVRASRRTPPRQPSTPSQ
jgi:glycosyltransferase 2 family protein